LPVAVCLFSCSVAFHLFVVVWSSLWSLSHQVVSYEDINWIWRIWRIYKVFYCTYMTNRTLTRPIIRQEKAWERWGWKNAL
jgi:hypothetical protein